MLVLSALLEKFVSKNVADACMLVRVTNQGFFCPFFTVYYREKYCFDYSKNNVTGTPVYFFVLMRKKNGEFDRIFYGDGVVHAGFTKRRLQGYSIYSVEHSNCLWRLLAFRISFCQKNDKPFEKGQVQPAPERSPYVLPSLQRKVLRNSC